MESLSEWEIISGLSKRLGISALSFNEIEEIREYQLAGTGVCLADFAEKGLVELTSKPVYEQLSSQRLKTESHKIEVINSSWEKIGIASLAPFSPTPTPGPGLYRLTTGSCALHTKGHTINNPRLFAQMPENTLWISSATARDLGVSDGDRVMVSGNGYSAEIQAVVSPYLHPEAVFMVPGFGRRIPAESRAMGRGASDIRLMCGGLDLCDPSGGGLALQEHFVVVRKA
jgi:thiosulfate reductase/polysulfide reductase chain A